MCFSSIFINNRVIINYLIFLVKNSAKKLKKNKNKIFKGKYTKHHIVGHNFDKFGNKTQKKNI